VSGKRLDERVAIDPRVNFRAFGLAPTL